MSNSLISNFDSDWLPGCLCCFQWTELKPTSKFFFCRMCPCSVHIWHSYFCEWHTWAPRCTLHLCMNVCVHEREPEGRTGMVPHLATSCMRMGKKVIWWIFNVCVTNLSQWEGGKMKGTHRHSFLSQHWSRCDKMQKHKLQLKGSVFGVGFALSSFFALFFFCSCAWWSFVCSFGG